MQTSELENKYREVPNRNTLPAIKQVFDRLRSQSRTEPAWSYEKRIELLDQLELLQKENETAIINAVDADFGGKEGGRGLQWSRLTELFMPLTHAKHVKEHLKSWMRKKKVSVGFPFNLMGKSYCMYQPLGVILCIAPWNFPVLLLNGPLADMLGAGNRVVLKPSESTPQTGALLSRLFSRYFPGGEVVVFEGDYKVAQYLTSLPFDHILFTGSGNVAKKVMKSASQNLVPLTLELGGKSPVLVAPDYPLEAAAKAIIDSKIGNAGQQCNGVDYVLLPRGKATKFARICFRRVRERWGETSLENNAEYCSIINCLHYNRIKNLVDDARKKNARVVSLDPIGIDEYLGDTNRFPPTLILPPFDPNDLAVMKEEIFGPLIPIVEIDSVEDAIAFINERPRPLAFYAFTNDKHVKNTVLNRIVCGGVTINNISIHAALPSLPFGGVGPSGMGAVHGSTGFKTFSHEKSVFEQKRMLVPGIVHPLAQKEVDKMMLLLKLKLGDCLKKTCSVTFLITLVAVAYYCSKNYEISILRKF
jgi:coniferyl-aldehyde dehydrogenase